MEEFELEKMLRRGFTGPQIDLAAASLCSIFSHHLCNMLADNDEITGEEQ